MKTKYLFLATTILVIVLTVAILGQTKNNVKAKPAVKIHDIASMLGKPAYESKVDSLDTKVWILTRKKQKEMMDTYTGQMGSKMKSDSKTIDKKTKDGILAGTHCIILDVTNILNKKEFADTSAKVEIVSPSKKMSSVNFIPMMSYFGGGITLDEKGEYLFTINLNVGSGYKTSQFKYKVK
jgi:hypothetical protein